MEDVEFGRYRLQSLLGQGGMGKVYKAYDTLIGRDVAIKVLPPALSADDAYRARFRREAHTSARLTEPHIIPIHDTGEIDGQLYLVMPVVEGIDLQALLKRDGPMSPQRAVHVIEQLAAALDAAHTAGLVHRDVKPSNALLTGRDFVYLIDFGIAHDSDATSLTNSGMVLGSWAYMAPERFTARGAGASADVYSLTCVLYECLTGAQPYPGKSMEQQFAGHYSADPPRPSAVNPALPSGFDDVIARGMAKDPDERYAGGLDLAAAARDALNTAPTRVPDAAAAPPDDAPAAPVAALGATRAAPEPTWTNTTPAPVGDTGPEPAAADTSQPPIPATLTSTQAAPQPTWTNTTPAPVGPTALDTSQPPPAATVAYGPEPPAGLTPIGRGQPRPVPTVAAQASRRLPPPPPPPADRLNVTGTRPRRLLAPPPSSATPAQPPRSGAQGESAAPARRRPRRGQLIAVAAVCLVVASVAITGYLMRPSSESSTATVLPAAPGAPLPAPAGQSVSSAAGAAPTAAPGSTAAPSTSGASGQLPFSGINGAVGVAVDGAGDVFVTDAGGSRVLVLKAGSASATTMSFTGLSNPAGLAVDGNGDVFVANTGTSEVLKLAAGSTSTTELPFGTLTGPRGVAVDSAGDLYVCGASNTVVKLAAGSTNTTEAAFTGLNNPGGVAVSGGGDVYVADSGNNRVLKLTAGATTADPLPFTGLKNPTGVAVGTTGALYVADSGNSRVLRATAG